MVDHERSNECLPSTRYVWKRVKMSRLPKGNVTAPKGRHAWHRFARWPRKRPLTVTLYYRGGTEAFIAVKARGVEAYLPGHIQLIDLYRCICNDL